MKFKRILFLMFSALACMLLTACGALPLVNWPGVTVDNKYVYLADGQFVYTVQLSDGKEVTVQNAGSTVPLRFPAQADANIAIYSAPALTTDGQMIVGSSSTQTNIHSLYSVDPLTGGKKWSIETPGVWLPGAFAQDDLIYAPNGDGKLYAFDLKGKKRWESIISKDALWTNPVSDGKTLYIGTLAHDLIALDAETGEQRWQQTLDNAIIGAPALSPDGVLYVGTLSGNLYAFKATDGSQLWLAKLQGSIWSTPALDDTTLYVGTSNGTAGKFFAVDAANGRFLRNPMDETGAIIASPLVLKDQIVYVTEDGFINFIDKKGADLVSPVKIENAKIYTTPILAGDFILVAPMHAEFILAAYSQKGVQQWKFIPTR